jgi:hypothetical protein
MCQLVEDILHLLTQILFHFLGMLGRSTQPLLRGVHFCQISPALCERCCPSCDGGQGVNMGYHPDWSLFQCYFLSNHCNSAFIAVAR